MTENNMIPAKVKQMNTTALAYMGDAVYEVYVRRHVMESGQINADRLHYMAVPFVRAHGQATALKEMMKGFLTEEEASIARRARNHKTTSRPKNADPVEYKLATAFEALVGFLYLTGQEERLDQVMTRAVRFIREDNK